MATQTSLSIDDIIEAIGNLSVVELADLIERFKEKFGVTIAAPVAAAPAAGGAGAGAAAPVEEKTEFTVVLKGAGENTEQNIGICSSNFTCKGCAIQVVTWKEIYCQS